MTLTELHSTTKQAGFGVIEIMLAMLLSLFLIGGVIQVYLGSKQSYNMTEDLSRMQESGRFAMDMLSRDIRMAGFMPCKESGDVVNTLNSTSEMFDFFGGAIKGYEGGVSAFPSPTFPAVGTNPGDRVDGSDAIVILMGGNESYHVASHNAKSAMMHLGKEHNLSPNQIVMICDGEKSAIFQITNANQSNKTIVHNTGTGSPGNCTNMLAGAGDCSDSSGVQEIAYDDNAQVVAFEGHAYYVGVGSSGTTFSLYQISVQDDATTASEELLEGIESMQVLYGEDANDDSFPERYVTADVIETAGTWGQIVSVRIGLLIQSPTEVAPEDDSTQYNVAGTVVGPATTVAHAGDRRLRNAFNSTVKLRNRGL